MTLEQLVVIIKAETAGLEKGIDKVKGQLSSLEKVAGKVSGNLSNAFNRTSSGLGKAFKTLSLGALTAGLLSFGKSAVNAASDLQEWQNVVDVAFGSASGEADKFAKMAVNRFGLSEVAAKKLTGTFMAMANGIGLSQAAGAKMSIQLSGLAADMASFFNTDYATTMNALEGVFTGQTRALKQFGIVMTEANLEAFRLSRGIQTAYSGMNEAQRAALRYNYVLAQTANSQNDFARTSMSWANQMRQLAMNWQSLTTTVGNQLIQLLTPVVAILNKILKAAIAVVNAIAKIFGGKGISKVGTSMNDAAAGAGGLADNIGNAGDGLGKADKAAKKFKATIAGFDELEVLNPQPTSGSGGGSGGGGGAGGGGGVGADDLDSYFDLYDEEGMLNKFEDFFQKIKDMMDADNWEGVGAEIGKGLNYIFKAIDDWITNTFEPFGILWANRIARVLNGLVDEVDWDLIGKTFADGLNAYIRIANEFYETFNALNFAVGIATAINSWFRNVDWEGIGTYLANKLNFLGDLLYGFATTIDWEQIKNSIQTALSTLFENLDVEKIKQSIQQLVNDALDFLQSIDWYEIGHTVGEMLSGVDWLGVFKSVKDDVIWPAFKGFWDGLMSDGKNFILGTVGKVASWFQESFWGPFAAGALSVAGTNVLLGALRGFFTGGEDTHFFGAIVNSMTWVITSLGGLVPGWGKEWSGIFADAFKVDAEKLGLGKAFASFFEDTIPSAVGSAAKAFSGFASKVAGVAGPIAAAVAIITSLTSAYGGLGGVIQRIGKVFTDAGKYIKGVMDALGATETIQYAKEAFGRLGESLKKVYDSLAVLKPLWEIVFNVISAAIGVVGGIIGTVIAGIVGFIGALADAAAAIIDTFWTPISAVLGWVGDLCQGIIDFFADLKYQLIGDPIIIDMWDAIMKCFSDAIKSVIDFVKGLVEKVIKFFTGLWNKAVEIFNNIKAFLEETWSNIKEKTTEVWNSIKQWLSETWTNIKQKVTDTWNAIKQFLSDTWESIKTKTSEIWESIKSTLSQTWESIKTKVSEVWESIKTKIGEVWEGIKTKVSNAVNSVKTTVSNAWENIKTTSSQKWEKIKTDVSNIWDNIKKKAETVTGKIKGFFKDAYDGIKKTWQGFGSWFEGVFSGLGGTVRSAFNAVIGKINGIGITVPSWVPEIGGRHFGFSVPYLASGGVIDSPTLAMMGEYSGARSNPEIVAPQSMIREIISEENGEMVSALYQIANQIITAIDGVDMSVTIGDDTIANAANRGNNNYKKRTGKPLFSM